jgi:Fe-S cluster assembly protein SufD
MESTITSEQLISVYSDIYNKNKELYQKSSFHGLTTLRENALADLQKMGFPNKKSECYKYTNLEPFFARKYNFVLEPGNISLDSEEVFKCDVPELGVHTVILLNGHYYHKNPLNGALPDGVWIGSLRKAIDEQPLLVEKYIGKIAIHNDGLDALNTAIFRDGLFVHIPKGVTLSKPLQVINILLSESDLFTNQRNLVVLEENSNASIVFCDHTLTSNNYFTNSITEIFAGDGAILDLSNLQNEHNEAARVASVFIQQDKNSKVNSSTVTLHGGMIRNNFNIKLNGEGAESNTYGLFLTDKNQHVDNNVFVEHAKPHCTSNQMFKGVLNDISTGAFNGKILVDRDAQKTIAYQKNSNLLLTSEAKMNTRPQLEIYADDVKCSHGATVGQLDLEAMFYMQARGISKVEARLLLMFAFTHEIVQHITIENLRFRIDEMVNKRLRGELSRCHNCTIHCN